MFRRRQGSGGHFTRSTREDGGRRMDTLPDKSVDILPSFHHHPRVRILAELPAESGRLLNTTVT